MTAQASFIIGPRGTEFGVFVAPPGIDARFATPAQLLLHISQFAAQIILRGFVVGGGFVPFSLPYAPIALPTSLALDLNNNFGAVTPWYNGANLGQSTIATSTSGITVSNTNGDRVGYLVFSSPAP